ncbi:MAG: hypothetical protein M3Y72_21290 [Acidobacteriota bacterium]|nr:hypothetical protein [Acidobacteriota bacterium]
MKQHARELLDGLGPGPLAASAVLPHAHISSSVFRHSPEGGVPFEQVVAECGFTMATLAASSG